MRSLRSLSLVGAALCALFAVPALPAGAASITWMLRDVTFDDGGTASGTVEYDADLDAIVSWNVSVSGGDTETFPPLSYTPGTGGALTFDGGHSEPTLRLDIAGTTRQLRMTPTTALDGSARIVSLMPGTIAGLGGEECFNCSPFRLITGGFFVGPLARGSSEDPFDASRGTVVVDSDAQADPINAFRTSGGFEDGHALMGNGGLGSVSFIEFETPTPRGILGVRLLAHNDSDFCCLRRTMSRFTLLADVDGDGIYETPVIDAPISPDYGLQPGNAGTDPSDLDVTLLSVGPVQSKYWMLEVTQGSDVQPFEGVRLVEVDALPAPPEDCTNEVDDDGDGLVDVQDPECDRDGDVVNDVFDNCAPMEGENTFNPRQEDRDGDGVGDACDDCPNDYDPEQDFEVCPRRVTETAAVESPAGQFNPGESVPVVCSFSVAPASDPITVIRPDEHCLSTTLSCVDDGGRQLSPVLQLPPAVGIPDDVITVDPGESFEVYCDLALKFFETELGSGPEGDPETYSCDCTFSSYHQDPDIDENGACTAPEGCVDLDVVTSTSPPFQVTIAGEPVETAGIDIKPGSCPNMWNPRSNGVLKVAILGGSEDLDVAAIDKTTLAIARADGVGGSAPPNDGPPGPKGAVLADVATPFLGSVNDCHELEGDGVPDLQLTFRSDDVASALEMDGLPKGALVQLVVSGQLLDGTPFEASGDAVRLVAPGTPPGAVSVSADLAGAWIAAQPLDERLDEGGFTPFVRTYPLTTEVTLRAPASQGGRTFQGWRVDGGELVPGPELTLAVSGAEHEVRAVYNTISCGLGAELALLLPPLYWLRRRRAGRRARALLTGLIGLALWLPAGPARAQSLDADADGFPDALEATGLPLHDGSVYPACASDTTLARSECVAPGSPDLFLIIDRADPACDPLVDARCIPPLPEATEYLSNPRDAGGLGIAVHEIGETQAGPDRAVSPASVQKAVRITEDRNPASDKLGNCPSHGTPNGEANCKVFTQKIFDYVSEVCAGASTCDASTGESGVDDIVRRYVKHTLNHEIAHNFLLTNIWNKRFGGWHEKAGSFVIMEQSSKYTNKGGRVTWYISTEFGIPSQEGFILVEP